MTKQITSASDVIFPAPPPTIYPETKPFWDATLENRLLLPTCDACDVVIWYPRAFCPKCGSQEVNWFQASGHGAIYSFTLCRRGGGDYRGIGIYVLAYVELEEGPRVMTNIVDCDPEQLNVGDEVEAVYHLTKNEGALLRFRPVRSAGG
jgi:hypothetical protein